MLLMALACGATAEAAAQKAGVSRRTVQRRLADPAFRPRLVQIRADMAQRIAGMLTAAAGEAVKALLELLAASNPSPARLGAVRTVLEYGLKLREAADLEERVAAVEDHIAAQLAPPPES